MAEVVVLATSFLDAPIALQNADPTGADILAGVAADHGIEVEYRCQRDPGEPLSAPELDGVTAVIADLERYTAAVLNVIGPRGGGTVRVIVRYGVGYDSVDVTAATEAGIIVANTPGANSAPTAEWAVATILAVAGRRSVHHARAAAGLRKTGPSRIDVSGKVLGIIGTGAVGRIVVDLLSGFRVTVLASDPYPDEVWAEAHGVRYVAGTRFSRTPTSSRSTPRATSSSSESASLRSWDREHPLSIAREVSSLTTPPRGRPSGTADSGDTA